MLNKKDKVVTIEQGKELMEFGYPETPFTTEYHYSTYDNQLYQKNYPCVMEYHEPRVPAPYIHDVIDWFREDIGFNLSINYSGPMYDDIGWDGELEWIEWNPNMKENQVHHRFVCRKPKDDNDAGLVDSPIEVMKIAINKCLKIMRERKHLIINKNNEEV